MHLVCHPFYSFLIDFVGRIRTGTGTSTCPACMYYKTKSIATFTEEQFINSILYYHCAHSNHLMLPTGYEPGFAKLQILSFLYMLLNYRQCCYTTDLWIFLPSSIAIDGLKEGSILI